jgi:phosphoribosyl 1,2-cyclic phosphate phosphodiesterase
LICGSGASEAVPALFCTCNLCREAWKRGGKDRRSRTAYQLGETIRIDAGPDLYYQREKFQLHLEKWKHLFITHPHKDHFMPQNLLWHRHEDPGPAVLPEEILHFYGTKETIDLLYSASAAPLPLDEMRLAIHEMTLGEKILLPEEGMSFTPIWANHYCEGAVNFIVEMADGYTFFIGTDSGRILPHTWEELKKWKFDMMILDATAGKLPIEEGGHMTAPQALAAAERLRQEGIAKKECRFIVNHFAHCAGMLHEDLEKFFLPHGIEPAFDGMEVEIGF